MEAAPGSEADWVRGGLIFRFGFWKADDALVGFELTALFQKVHALEALQYTAFGLDGAFAFKAGMLTHSGEIIAGCLVKSNQKRQENAEKIWKRD